MHRVQHNNMVEYRTNWKKNLFHQTYGTSIRLWYSTIKSQCYPTTYPKITKIPKTTSHFKKVFRFLSIGFPDLTHRRREPPALPTLSPTFISTARLFSSSNISSLSLFPFFFLLSILFEISRVSAHLPRSTNSKLGFICK